MEENLTAPEFRLVQPETVQIEELTPQTQPPPLLDVYRLVSAKLCWSEWYRLSPNLLSVPIVFLAKLLGQDICAGVRAVVPRDPAAIEVPYENFTSNERAKLESHVSTLVSLGFRVMRYVRLTNPFNSIEVVGADLLAPDFTTVGRVAYAHPMEGVAGKEQVDISLMTGLEPDRFVESGIKPPKFQRPPEFLKGAVHQQIPTLLRLHYDAVARHAAGSYPKTIEDLDDIRAFSKEYEDTGTRFHVARGVYEPMGLGNMTVEPGSDPVEQNVLSEVALIQSKRGKNGTPLLLLSLVVAAYFWVRGFHIKEGLWIVGILLLHECGHFVTMRIFRYKDLRMFFIPFLGAAVIGRHYNVPGWKKALVSLMGPIPGIFFGAAMIAASILGGTTGLGKAGILMVVINVLNLLPMVPLDGGWFWNAVLFCRHPWLEVGFKGFALLAAAAASAMGMGRFWLYLGISMVMNAKSTLRLGGIARKLVREGRIGQPTQDDVIPVPAVRIILSELKRDGKRMQPAALARETLQVFERINARPPNALESIGLSFLYGIAVIVAVVAVGFGMVFGDFNNFKPKAVPTPVEEPAAKPFVAIVDATIDGNVRQWPEDAASLEGMNANVWAKFKSSQAADTGFESVRSQLSPQDAITRIGPFLVIGTPRQSPPRMQKLEAMLKEAGGSPIQTRKNSAISFDARWMLPDVERASAMLHDIKSASQWSLGWQIPPPWENAPDKQPKITRAADTLAKIAQIERETWADPRVKTIQRKAIWRAWLRSKSNNDSPWKGAAIERAGITSEKVRQLLAANDPDIDRDLVTIWLEENAAITTGQRKEWASKVSAYLGYEQFASQRWDIAPFVARSGNVVSIRIGHIGNPHSTLAHLADYWKRNGASDIQIGIQENSEPDFDEDE